MHSLPPPTGLLYDWLRTEAQRPFEQPRGDVGDQLPLQWLNQAIDKDPTNAARLVAAVEQLLGENDPVVSARILDVASLPETSPLLRAAVASAIGRNPQALAGLADGTRGTLLGTAVRALGSGKVAGPLDNDTLDTLLAINRPEDGWPESVRIGLTAGDARFLPKLTSTLAQASDEQLQRFVLGLLATTDSRTVKEGLERVGREAPSVVRDRVAAAVKAKVYELGEARERMRKMGVALPNFDPPQVEWARHAASLGVPA